MIILIGATASIAGELIAKNYIESHIDSWRENGIYHLPTFGVVIMRQYYFTDKLLLGLAIINLWMLVPALWGTWQDWSFFHNAQGNRGPLLTSIFLSTAYWLIIQGFTTFAFLKRWRWVVVFYVLYLSHTIPITIYTLIESWKDREGLSFLDLRLFSYTKALVWLLTVVALITMIIETDYKNLFNRWHGRFI